MSDSGLQIEDSAISQRAERMLIVDDEASIRDILTQIVSREGFRCHTARDGQEAVQRLRETEYQMILSDIEMPGLNGSKLLEHVSTHYPETAVIMVTGLADIKSAVSTMSMGAYDYVTKPFTFAELTTKIHKALERRRRAIENSHYQWQLQQMVQEQATNLQKALGQLDGSYANTLEALINALDARERETQRHSKRVSEYTWLMADRLGVRQNQLADIERGALLHDIGKIGVSDKILLKPAKLTEEEWVEVRKHPEIGYSILKGIDFLKGAAEMVLQHHERFDGTGYPRGLSGEQILLGARIFAIVDTFEAMTSDRPYRKALGYQTAREEIIRFSGKQFDPQLVECFLSIPEEVWFKTKESLRRGVILEHLWTTPSTR